MLSSLQNWWLSKNINKRIKRMEATLTNISLASTDSLRYKSPITEDMWPLIMSSSTLRRRLSVLRSSWALDGNPKNLHPRLIKVEEETLSLQSKVNSLLLLLASQKNLELKKSP